MKTSHGNDYVVVVKNEDRLMRFIGWFSASFMRRATTYRLPFMRAAKVCIPANVGPKLYLDVVEHEKVHVDQFAPWYGPWWVIAAQVLPLPVFFSGRWFVERDAYLQEIKHGTRTLEEAIDVLWSQYGWCWPRKLMRKWFISKLTERA